MSTQRTRVGQGSGTRTIDPRDQKVEKVSPPQVEGSQELEPEQEQGEDLGIPDGMIDDDPGGYVPRTEVQTVAGRKMRPVSGDDLDAAHAQYAGNVRVTGERVRSGDGMRTEQQAPDPNDFQAGSDATAVAEARRLMPSTFTRRPQEDQPSKQNTQPPPATEEAAQTLSRAAASFEYLKKLDHEARASGDPEKAAQTAALLTAMQDSYKIQEKPVPQGRHPVLQRLVEHFGLEKIKPVELEWFGFKWRFAPTSTKLDLWVGESLATNNYNAASLLLASSVVGIDGTPIFKVLNVPIRKEFVVSSKEGNASKTVALPLYSKTCTCGSDIEVDDEKCATCGAQQDVFNMPLSLRIECAVRLNKFLEENFGVYEELANLVAERDKLMKNRMLDQGELYPFLPKKPSSEAEKTQE